MDEPVVSMTPRMYWLCWAGVWLMTMMVLYFVVRSAVKWGVAHGMDTFIRDERAAREAPAEPSRRSEAR